MAALDTFVKQLADSGILTPGKLENFVPPKAHPQSVDELVAELVKHKELTPFQATQVKAGKVRALILGEYTLVDRIGAGGMGQVFKAVHRRMDRTVAIKMLPPAMTKDAAALARFEREVRAAAKLSHPHIVAAYDAGQAGPSHFLVMEYVDGKDLSAIVKKDGPLPVGKAVNYLLQAARGLEFAHGEGVVHRDIKPANLLLDKKGVVKILDMGLARVAGATESGQMELTGSGMIMGTVDFMSPEQAIATKHADHRADIYSLGITLYYLLSGKMPYSGDTAIEKLMAHQTQPIPNLQDVQTTVPKQLDAVFKKMVAKKVDDRYQSMGDVIEALEELGLGTTSTKKSAVTSTVALSPEQKKKLAAKSTDTAVSQQTKRRLAIAGGALAIIVVPLLAFYLIGYRERKDEPAKPPVAASESAGPAAVVTQTAGPPRIENDRAPTAKQAETAPWSSDPATASFWEGAPNFWQFSAGKIIGMADADAGGLPTYLCSRRDFRDFEFRCRVRLVRGDTGIQVRSSKSREGFRLHGPQVDISATGWGNLYGQDWPGATKVVPRELVQPFLKPADFNDLVVRCVGKRVSIQLNGHTTVDQDFPNIADQGLIGLQLYKPGTEAEFRDISLQRLDELQPSGGARRVGPPAVAGDVVYLDDLEEFSKQVPGPVKLGKHGINSVRGSRIYWQGKEVTHSLFTAPGADPIWVIYHVDGNYGEFRATTKLDTKPRGPLTFRVFGDDKLLWESQPVSEADVGVDVIVPIRGVQMLKLEVYAHESATLAHPVWIDPRLMPLDSGAKRWQTPEFQKWVAETQKLPAEKQLEAVSKKLMELNPGFDGKLTEPTGAPRIENRVVTGLSFNADEVTDLSPLRALAGLKHLNCRTATRNGKLSDLSPLQGLPLEMFTCAHNNVSDLSPLAGMQLAELLFSATKVTDLSPLRGMPLASLNFQRSPVTDLSPLRGMQLNSLNCAGSNVSDLSPIAGMPLVTLLTVKPEQITKGIDSLRRMSSLQTIGIDANNKWTAAEFWKKYDAGDFGKPAATKKLAYLDAAFQQWVKATQALPAEKQIDAVSKKLMELNPGFDGRVTDRHGKGTPKIENAIVKDFAFAADNVTDISPVRALAGLNYLFCNGSTPGKPGRLSDLSPLQGMSLTALNASISGVSDLSPLAGMPLKTLVIYGTKVSDLSPLKGMQLSDVQVHATQISDLSPLRGMPLTYLNCGGALVTDLSPLQGSSLTQLYCGGNQLVSLSPLKGLPLTYLHCINCPVSDLSPLQECKHLKTLNVTNTKVTPATVAALQKALPNCKIEWDDPAKATTSATAPASKK